MDTGLYSLGAAFQDDHPDLVDDVIAQSEEIEEHGLEAWSAAEGLAAQDRLPDVRDRPRAALLPRAGRLSGSNRRRALRFRGAHAAYTPWRNSGRGAAW